MGGDVCNELKHELNELLSSPLNGLFESVQVDIDVDDVVQEYLLEEEKRLRDEQEKRWLFEEQLVKRDLFLNTLKEEMRLRVEKETLEKSERERNKRKRVLMNSAHWKAATCTVSNCKRSQRSRDLGSYYWGATYDSAEKERVYNCVPNRDMTPFLKAVQPWIEELKRPNKATDRVNIT